MKIEIDFNFWAIMPALNINLHSNELEFEWLCIGIYLDGKKIEVTVHQRKNEQ